MEYIRQTLVENFGNTGALAKSHETFSLEADVPDLSGKVALVTGGTEGIGFGCTHTLLAHNISRLFILSLRKEKADEALAAIAEEFGPAAREKVVWTACDLSDWDATARVAADIATQTDRLDIVVCNAARGIMTRQLAPSNGTDLHMAANHIGHVVLLSELLPLLKSTASSSATPVRIVNLASNLHESAPAETKFADLDELNKDYGPNAQYARSKLATLLHAKYLARHLGPAHPNVRVNATHPGIVDTAQTNTHIHEAYPLLGYGMSVGLKAFRKSQFEGCVSTMFAATACEASGRYIAPPAIYEEGSPKANDEALQEQLMKLTRDVVKEKTGREIADF